VSTPDGIADEGEDDLFEQEGDEPTIRWFVAVYDSDCTSCGALLREGALGGYIGNDDEASCEPCCRAA
jgi:hypothetical protein